MNLSAQVIVGDNRETLKGLADKSVQTVVTSPPYFGLRDYGTKTWVGGDESCEHIKDSHKTKKFGNPEFNKNRPSREATKLPGYYFELECGHCGALQEDYQIGLENTPQAFVEELCKVFDEVWRVLKDDGTLWVNLGDSYSSFRDSKAVPDSLRNGDGTAVSKAANRNPEMLRASGLKHKDLIGIPWRFAFAMQERGWYLRQDIIWAKPNPMPESVTDRCTKSHEYIFLMTKSAKYFYDNEAIKEDSIWASDPRAGQGRLEYDGKRQGQEGTGQEAFVTITDKKNKRDVWNVAVKSYKEAHFATYPPELITPCILAGSKENDIVLDPFSGSGTTGEVALQHGRNYIGLELNPEYAKLSEKRLTQAVGMFGQVSVK